jgi:hypothetical protein
MELAVFYELIEIPHGTDIDVQRAPEGIASLPKSENTVITWDIGWHVGHKGSERGGGKHEFLMALLHALFEISKELCA